MSKLLATALAVVLVSVLGVTAYSHYTAPEVAPVEETAGCPAATSGCCAAKAAAAKSSCCTEEMTDGECCTAEKDAPAKVNVETADKP